MVVHECIEGRDATEAPSKNNGSTMRVPRKYHGSMKVLIELRIMYAPWKRCTSAVGTIMGSTTDTWKSPWKHDGSSHRRNTDFP